MTFPSPKEPQVTFSHLTLRWRHDGRDSVSNHQPHGCLLNRLFRRRSKKTSKLCVTGLCAGNWPGTGEFPTQMASNAENAPIWWRHHELPGTSGLKESFLSGGNALCYVTANSEVFTRHPVKITHCDLGDVAVISNAPISNKTWRLISLSIQVNITLE